MERLNDYAAGHLEDEMRLIRVPARRIHRYHSKSGAPLLLIHFDCSKVALASNTRLQRVLVPSGYRDRTRIIADGKPRTRRQSLLVLPPYRRGGRPRRPRAYRKNQGCNCYRSRSHSQFYPTLLPTCTLLLSLAFYLSNLLTLQPLLPGHLPQHVE